jgi:xylulokinase
LRTLDLKAGLMGASLDPGQLAGAVRADAPGGWDRWQGVPIAECGFDAWSASFGIGCVHDGAVYNNCGTTEVFGAFGVTARQIPGISSLPWSQGLYHLGGPCLTGLGTLAWFGERFLGDADPASVLACAAQAGPDVPMCVPFVTGERMPFWRADLRASFIGVQSQHGRPEFARALVDGLLVFQRRLLRLLAASPQSVFLSGGGAALPGWAALKASAFSVPVRLPAGEEPGLLGAAMCALVALGTFDSLGQAQDALAPTGRLVEPDPLIMRRLQTLEPLLWPHFPVMPIV